MPPLCCIWLLIDIVTVANFSSLSRHPVHRYLSHMFDWRLWWIEANWPFYTQLLGTLISVYCRLDLLRTDNSSRAALRSLAHLSAFLQTPQLRSIICRAHCISPPFFSSPISVLFETHVHKKNRLQKNSLSQISFLLVPQVYHGHAWKIKLANFAFYLHKNRRADFTRILKGTLKQ